MFRRPLRIPLLFLACAVVPAAAVAQGTFFNSNGVRIHYIEKGAGEPLVLVHGLGSSIESWRNAGVFDTLAARFRVIALDCRGFGKSDKPHDPKAYGAEMPLDVIRLLDHLGIKRAHIVGYSMGASVTSHLLVTHPDRFLTATLGGGGGPAEDPPTNALDMEKIASETERYGFSPTLTQSMAPKGAPPLTQEEIQKRSKDALANTDVDRFAMAAYDRGGAGQSVKAADAAKVKVPTLGIVGGADPRAQQSLQRLKRVRPALTVVIVDGATHSGTKGLVPRPEFVDGIMKFIATHKSP